MAAVVFAAVLLDCGASCFGQVIRLRGQSTAERNQEVRLGDIATVSGTDGAKAEDLANTVILSSVQRTENIKAETVLLALMAQRGVGAIEGNLQMGGAAVCEITLAGEKPAKQPGNPGGDEMAAAPARAMSVADVNAALLPVPATSATKPASAGNVPATLPEAANTTLAKLIEARAQQDLEATPDEVRVSFETISPLLDQPVAAGRRWLCRPLVRVPLGTVQFEAQLVEGARVVERLTVQTKVEKRQTVLVATAKLARGDLVTAGKLRVQQTWQDRRMPTLFGRSEEVLGLEAQKDVEIGAMLDQRDFKPLLMAHRNEMIKVIYIAGALEVQMTGQALGDAKYREQVDVRNEKTGERYTATMLAKGVAVAGGTLTEEQERKLREAQ